MSDRRPPVFGRYECLVPLGRGGMAEVWVARAKGARGFEKLLAIKTMLPAMLDDPAAEAMFLDEARLAARIRHPNVTEIMDLGEEAGQLFIVMDWIDGDSAAALARTLDAPMPLPLALHIAIEAGKGLHAAHELLGPDDRPMGLVHRDVSPHNVLLARTGLVVLSDFGIAKALGHTSRTDTGVVKGKPGYMAPEQAMGAALDRRADVFALGVLLYELVARKHPFRGSNPIETAERLLRQPFLAPSHHVPNLPRELDAVILRALQRDPDARYATAEELGDALQLVARRSAGEASSRQLGEFLEAQLGPRLAARDAAIRAALSATAAPQAFTPAAPEPLPATARQLPLDDGAGKGVAVTQVSLARALPASDPITPRGKVLALALLAVGVAGAGYWWNTVRVAQDSQALPLRSATSAGPVVSATPSAAPPPPAASSAPSTTNPPEALAPIPKSSKPTVGSRAKTRAAPERPASSGARPVSVPVRDPGF